MTASLDPKEFGLPARTILVRVDAETIAIVLDRKSRIIMADGHKVVEKAKKVKHILPGSTVLLKTSAPVCSKTTAYLAENGIRVVGLR